MISRRADAGAPAGPDVIVANGGNDDFRGATPTGHRHEIPAE